MDVRRRNFLSSLLYGAGALGLRSVATGIPAALLQRPLTAHAQPTSNAGILILSVSSFGEPLNCNAPGMYEPGLAFIHPRSSRMAPAPLSLGGRTYEAAQPWADLGADIHRRLTCIHHGTYTGIHAQQSQVLRLMGNTRRAEMLPSIFAHDLAPRLNTVQPEPIALGAGPGELVEFEGRTLPKVAPTSLSRILGDPEGPLAAFQEVRDRDLDRLNAIYKEHGTPRQRALLDRFARSRTEARSLATTLLDRLSSIEDDEADSQIIAAPVVAAMNLTPVITIHLGFGGDNHNDPNFTRETNEHISGLRQVRDLVRTLDSFRSEGILRVPVTFATLGVFGRTVRGRTTGRDHSAGHHVMAIISDNVRSSVVGGVDETGRARAIDAETGSAVPESASGANIVPFRETLQASAKTLGAVLGVQRAYLEENIQGGRAVSSVLT